MTRYGLKLRKRCVKSKQVQIHEFTVYADLVLREASTRLKELGITDTKVYSKAPKTCNHCNSHTIVAIEVLGAKNEALFWMCDDCEAIFLKFDSEETERLLEKSSKCWTNPEDWGAYTEELN